MARGDKKEEREKAERETRRKLAQAQIRQFPDPVLRSETRPILEFDEELKALALRMLELADDAVGAGLAAPQIGLLRKFVVISLRDDEPWLAMANPEILQASEETEVGGEGCLSLDILLRSGHSVPVERNVEITVRWQDLEGENHEEVFRDMDARIVQHELDHLLGTVLLDRVSAFRRSRWLKKVRRSAEAALAR